ncbi:hypothetical protein NL676_008311 [Syzygium grande]|nr:hypothetical protein NL676_008311 [Syzygium grande]
MEDKGHGVIDNLDLMSNVPVNPNSSTVAHEPTLNPISCPPQSPTHQPDSVPIPTNPTQPGPVPISTSPTRIHDSVRFSQVYSRRTVNPAQEQVQNATPGAANENTCYAAWYGLCPGLKMLAPYSSEDARGLLKAATRDPDAVVFLENELTYGERFPVSAEALDSSFCLPIGKAKIEREGKDVTITAFSKMVGLSLEAAVFLAKEGISAEVINLLSIRPLDRPTINASVRKTNRLVTVEEGFPQHGVGAEIGV